MLKVRLEQCNQDISDADYRMDLVMVHNRKEVLRECDGGEPEDQLLTRDWSWVKPAIEQAYKLGHEEGFREGQILAHLLV